MVYPQDDRSGSQARIFSLNLEGNLDISKAISITGLRNAIFVASVQKAGSVMLDNITRDICVESSLPYCDFEPQMFSRGIVDVELTSRSFDVLEQLGVVFFGFRSLRYASLARNFRCARKILLVRDPRDIAVSYYFSTILSHSIPDSGAMKASLLEDRIRSAAMTVNEFVIDGFADYPLHNLNDYAKLAELDPDIKVYRYEDVIFNKREWVKSLCSDFDTSLDSETIYSIADRQDIFPEREDPAEHVRQVHPGNYRKYLNKASIERVQRIIPKVFHSFHYEFESS